MINHIYMEDVASFKNSASLTTDKKVTLVYGLNGTGKTTLSNFLYSPNEPRFHKCRQYGAEDKQVFVYNQQFVEDNFYLADSLKGIFNLSRENKEAEEKISSQESLLSALRDDRKAREAELKESAERFDKARQTAIEQVWKIKSTYTGGDRVLEYCLSGLKGNKEKLFDYLLSIPESTEPPEKTVSEIKEDVSALKDDACQPQIELRHIGFSAQHVEQSPLITKEIVGNEQAEIGSLIEHLGNSDWVHQGLRYLPDHIDPKGSPCPFCQQQTITDALVQAIKEYFDNQYQSDLDDLHDLYKQYRQAYESLPPLTSYTSHSFAENKKGDLTQNYQALTAALERNLQRLKQKIEAPSTNVELVDSGELIESFNIEVDEINKSITEFNKRLENLNETLEYLKSAFWENMRWEYGPTVSRYMQDREEAKERRAELNAKIQEIDRQIEVHEEELQAARKETVNIQDAVEAINAALIDLGISEFTIVSTTDNRYRIVREGDSENAFHTLSEGEKMMISFLYFCELCKGSTDTESAGTQRVAVIDDPISSLSHVFVFNVGQTIRTLFFQSDRFVQVFVLTHSLYFFYELTDANHQRRRESQKLARMVKPESGTEIQDMKYEEIQNDYQAYWAVVNNPDQPAALIANCMRNIVEYFFSFVRKKDLNNVFQMPELQEAKYQAFCRYINRESHSLGQNIFDMKEFDYEAFHEGLRLVFKNTGYTEHYDEMSKL